MLCTYFHILSNGKMMAVLILQYSNYNYSHTVCVSKLVSQLAKLVDTFIHPHSHPALHPC